MFIWANLIRGVHHVRQGVVEQKDSHHGRQEAKKKVSEGAKARSSTKEIPLMTYFPHLDSASYPLNTT